MYAVTKHYTPGNNVSHTFAARKVDCLLCCQSRTFFSDVHSLYSPENDGHPVMWCWYYDVDELTPLSCYLFDYWFSILSLKCYVCCLVGCIYRDGINFED